MRAAIEPPAVADVYYGLWYAHYFSSAGQSSSRKWYLPGRTPARTTSGSPFGPLHELMFSGFILGILVLVEPSVPVIDIDVQPRSASTHTASVLAPRMV